MKKNQIKDNHCICKQPSDLRSDSMSKSLSLNSYGANCRYIYELSEPLKTNPKKFVLVRLLDCHTVRAKQFSKRTISYNFKLLKVSLVLI